MVLGATVDQPEPEQRVHHLKGKPSPLKGKTFDETMTLLDEILTISEAADISGVNPLTLKNWIRAGVLPAARWRNAYVVSKVVLAGTIANQRLKDDIGAVAQTVFTFTEAARRLGCSREYVRQLANNGALPTIKLSKQRKVTLEAIDAFIKARENATREARAYAIEEVAERLTISPERVRSEIQVGSLPATRFGRQYRVFAKDLNRYIRDHRVIVAPRSEPEADFSPQVKDVTMVLCSSCNTEYERGTYASHINIAEHIRARSLRDHSLRI